MLWDEHVERFYWSAGVLNPTSDGRVCGVFLIGKKVNNLQFGEIKTGARDGLQLFNLRAAPNSHAGKFSVARPDQAMLGASLPLAGEQPQPGIPDGI